MGRAEQIEQGKKIVKAGKIVLLILLSALTLLIVSCVFIVALYNGAFNFMLPKEIATYNSPDGEYSLVFEQMGHPEWPFGSTDVRLTLKNRDGKTIKRVSTQIDDDGANAGERHIASISWNNDAVIVVLKASEMEDKEVIIAYHRN